MKLLTALDGEPGEVEVASNSPDAQGGLVATPLQPEADPVQGQKTPGALLRAAERRKSPSKCPGGAVGRGAARQVCE